MKTIRKFLLLLFLFLPQTLLANEEDNEFRKFIQGAGEVIYGLAWPTATYKKLEVAEVRRKANGMDVDVKLEGVSGFSGDPLWLVLTIEWRDGALSDIKVKKHNALLAEPFATTKAIAGAVSEAIQEANKGK